jgi:hypothetical protein
MEFAKNSRTLHIRSRCIFTVKSYLVFVTVSVGLVFGVHSDIRLCIKLTRARKSLRLIPMFSVRSWFAFTNTLGGNTDKHERARYVCSSRVNDTENQWE